MGCPSGYYRPSNPGECCPACIPVSGPTTIPPKCVRQELGTASIKIRGCSSNTTFLQTKCGGYCDSSSSATHGNNIYDSQCTCCTPIKVKQFTAFMKCAGSEADFETKFHVIEECSCTVMKCAGSNSLSGIHITDQTGAPVEQRR